MKNFILIITALGIALSVSSCTDEWEYEIVADLQINDIDLAKVNDGKYIGSFSFNRFTYVVETTVHENRYEQIDILQNRTHEIAKKAEQITSRVIENQSLNVDAISGATSTSKALLKAIENGLNGHEKNY